jgi:hypothetical protein
MNANAGTHTLSWQTEGANVLAGISEWSGIPSGTGGTAGSADSTNANALATSTYTPAQANEVVIAVVVENGNNTNDGLHCTTAAFESIGSLSDSNSNPCWVIQQNGSSYAPSEANAVIVTSTAGVTCSWAWTASKPADALIAGFAYTPGIVSTSAGPYATTGPGVSPSAQMQFFNPVLQRSQTRPNVIVALTGQAITSTAGSLLIVFQGQAIASGLGTLTPANSEALTGLAMTTAAGTLGVSGIPSSLTLGSVPGPGPGVGPFSNTQFAPQPLGFSYGVTLPLTGQALALTAGALATTTADALTGASMVSAAGTVAPLQGITVALGGQSFAAATGVIVVTPVSVPLTGQAIQSSTGTIAAGSGFRVQATAIGWYNDVYYAPGDVFDIATSADFANYEIDYLAGQPGSPFYGWMKQVPPSTPLTYPSGNYPVYDFQPPPRRTVF